MRAETLRNLKGGEFFLFPIEEKSRPLFEDETAADQSAIFLMTRTESSTDPEEKCFVLINGTQAGTEWISSYYNNAVVIVVNVQTTIQSL